MKHIFKLLGLGIVACLILSALIYGFTRLSNTIMFFLIIIPMALGLITLIGMAINETFESFDIPYWKFQMEPDIILKIRPNAVNTNIRIIYYISFEHSNIKVWEDNLSHNISSEDAKKLISEYKTFKKTLDYRQDFEKICK